jgi:hypothetical protein
MNNRQKAQLLIRLALKNPQDADILLPWADELLESASLGPAAPSAHDGGGPFSFPKPIFRVYKGRRYDASLLEGWQVEMDGAVYSSPSRAAFKVTDHQENGWRVWKYLDPTTGEGIMIDRLRHLR